MFKRIGYTLALLLMTLILVSAIYAQEPAAKAFEAKFTQSCEVEGFVFQYPADFTLSETTKGVFLETDALYGQISSGSAIYRNKAAAEEFLLEKQGGKALEEYTVNGHTVFAANSLQGEQLCRTYIVVPENTDNGDGTLYIQFRWRADDLNGNNYIAVLDHMVNSMR